MLNFLKLTLALVDRKSYHKLLSVLCGNTGVGLLEILLGMVESFRPVLFEFVWFLKRYVGGLLLILSDRLLAISATRSLGSVMWCQLHCLLGFYKH